MKRKSDSKFAPNANYSHVETSKRHGCGERFKTRGIKLHQKFCKDIEVIDFTFVIIDNDVFGNILGFLGNQTLVKLRSITGDHYPHCDRELAQHCCACENDNPVIVDGACYVCARNRDDYKPRITKTEAKRQYGINLGGIPCEVLPRRTLYNRVDLENRVFQVFGSRLGWAKSIAQRNSRMKNLAAFKRKRIDDYNAHLTAMSPAFIEYIKTIDIIVPRDQLDICHERFTMLSSALARSGLDLRNDSQPYDLYIIMGFGVLDEIVDAVEEMKFLHTHTKYALRCKYKIEFFRGFNREWYHHEEYQNILQSCRAEAKMELCAEYLGDNKGLVLPRKWEKCRDRYRDVLFDNEKVTRRVRYIYSGVGREPNRASSPSY